VSVTSSPDELTGEFYGDDACALVGACVPHEWRRRTTDGVPYLVVPQWAAGLLCWSPGGAEPEVLARAAADPEWRAAALFVLYASLEGDYENEPFGEFLDAHLLGWRERAAAEGRHLPGWRERAAAEGRQPLGAPTLDDVLGTRARGSDV
jgi:hypothetical protein